MKKLLSILGAISFTALATTTVVACSKEEAPKTPESLNGKTFEVALDSLVGPKAEVLSGSIMPQAETKSPQLQWGEKSIGFLYSTLWSINDKDAIKDGYTVQNQEVAKYLTKGESLVRLAADDGSDVTINGKTMSEIIKEGTDWHTYGLKAEDKVVFDMVVNSYSRDKDGNLVPTPTDVKITINLI